jgi:hypothetical protein
MDIRGLEARANYHAKPGAKTKVTLGQGLYLLKED